MEKNSKFEVFNPIEIVKTGPARNDFSDDPEAAGEPLVISDEGLVLLVLQLKELLLVGGPLASFARSAFQYYERRGFLTSLQASWIKEYQIALVA